MATTPVDGRNDYTSPCGYEVHETHRGSALPTHRGELQPYTRPQTTTLRCNSSTLGRLDGENPCRISLRQWCSLAATLSVSPKADESEGRDAAITAIQISRNVVPLTIHASIILRSVRKDGDHILEPGNTCEWTHSISCLTQ
jgi:hypothetical protein